MKSNTEPDGEYTDKETPAGTSNPPDERAATDTDVEGEYTDSDTPNEERGQPPGHPAPELENGRVLPGSCPQGRPVRFRNMD